MYLRVLVFFADKPSRLSRRYWKSYFASQQTDYNSNRFGTNATPHGGQNTFGVPTKINPQFELQSSHSKHESFPSKVEHLASQTDGVDGEVDSMLNNVVEEDIWLDIITPVDVQDKSTTQPQTSRVNASRSNACDQQDSGEHDESFASRVDGDWLENMASQNDQGFDGVPNGVNACHSNSCDDKEGNV